MAQPDYSPAQIAQLIDATPVGGKVGQFTLQSKSVSETCGGLRFMYSVTFSRGSSSWTGVYTEQTGGGVGKVYSLTDDDGRMWIPVWVDGAWV